MRSRVHGSMVRDLPLTNPTSIVVDGSDGPQSHLTGFKAIDVSSIKEVSYDEAGQKRVCSAKMLFNDSDESSIEYAIFVRNGSFFIELEMVE